MVAAGDTGDERCTSKTLVESLKVLWQLFGKPLWWEGPESLPCALPLGSSPPSAQLNALARRMHTQIQTAHYLGTGWCSWRVCGHHSGQHSARCPVSHACAGASHFWAPSDITIPVHVTFQLPLHAPSHSFALPAGHRSLTSLMRDTSAVDHFQFRG